MENKKERKEEIQSRREFFKKAAKGALPILGAVILASSPIISKAVEKESMGCYNSCYNSCLDTCKGTCATRCALQCSSCGTTCQKGCAASCNGGCKYSCIRSSI